MPQLTFSLVHSKSYIHPSAPFCLYTGARGGGINSAADVSYWPTTSRRRCAEISARFNPAERLDWAFRVERRPRPVPGVASHRANLVRRPGGGLSVPGPEPLERQHGWSAGMDTIRESLQRVCGTRGGGRAKPRVEGGRRGAGTHVMHGRSRGTVDPRIPVYNAGTEHVGFFTKQAGIACFCTKARKCRELFGESLEGCAVSSTKGRRYRRDFIPEFPSFDKLGNFGNW